MTFEGIFTAAEPSVCADAESHTYVWKTDKSWAGTCRQFTLTLADGNAKVANFKFS